MRSEVQKHFDIISESYDYYKSKNWFYYKNLKILLSKIIPKNKKVLEIGCGIGDLITYLKPKNGWGMDLSIKMITKAKIKHNRFKNIIFSTKYPIEKFDYVFMSDVVEHLDNPEKVFEKVSKLMGKKSLFIITMANPVWEPLLMFAEKIAYKMPEGPHKRIKYYDLKILLKKSNLKVVKHDYKLLMPIYIPLFTNFLNKYLEKYLRKYAFIEYIIAKKIF